MASQTRRRCVEESSICPTSSSIRNLIQLSGAFHSGKSNSIVTGKRLPVILFKTAAHLRVFIARHSKWHSLQDSYGCWKSWKALENGKMSWKTLEICKVFLKDIEGNPEGKIKQLGPLEEKFLRPGNLFLKRGTNPEPCVGIHGTHSRFFLKLSSAGQVHLESLPHPVVVHLLPFFKLLSSYLDSCISQVDPLSDDHYKMVNIQHVRKLCGR